MEKPIDAFSMSTNPGERVIDKPELPQQGLYTDNTVYTEVIAGTSQMKLGKFEKFEVFCDEGAHIGGSAEYPTPMTYMAMGVGF